MPQQHVLAIEAVPVVQVPLLPRLAAQAAPHDAVADPELARQRRPRRRVTERIGRVEHVESSAPPLRVGRAQQQDRKSTRLNSSHITISYAVFCLKKKKKKKEFKHTTTTQTQYTLQRRLV